MPPPPCLWPLSKGSFIVQYTYKLKRQHETPNCYTVIINRGQGAINEDWYGMSDNANMPNGFNMYIGTTADGNRKGLHLGKKVKLVTLPPIIQKCIESRIKEDLTI